MGDRRLRHISLGALVLMGTLATAPPALAGSEIPEPKLTMVEGDVTVRQSDGEMDSRAEVGRLLDPGDRLRTGRQSRAELECASARMRLYQNSEMIVPEILADGETKDVRKIILAEGSSIFNVMKKGRKSGFDFETKQILGGVKGTIFSLSTDREMTQVVVSRGAVWVADKRFPEKKITVMSGQMITFHLITGFSEKSNVEALYAWRDWDRKFDPDIPVIMEGDPFGDPPGGGGGDPGFSCPPENDRPW